MIQNCIVIGRTLSITSTSLEKRLRIRPAGVVSKNDIASLNTLCNSLPWRARAARRQPMANIKEVARTVTPEGESDRNKFFVILVRTLRKSKTAVDCHVDVSPREVYSVHRPYVHRPMSEPD